jgi:hypothetical protein
MRLLIIEVPWSGYEPSGSSPSEIIVSPASQYTLPFGASKLVI